MTKQHVSEEKLRQMVYRLCLEQTQKGAKHIKTESIEYAIYGNKGGNYHRTIAGIVDELGFDRIKHTRQATNYVNQDVIGDYHDDKALPPEANSTPIIPPKWMTERQEQIARLLIDEQVDQNGKVNIREILSSFDRPTCGRGHNWIASICDEKGYPRVKSRMTEENASKTVEEIVNEAKKAMDCLSRLIEKVTEFYP